MIDKIVIAGGNGFLGTLLSEYFQDKAKSIVILSRKKIETFLPIHCVLWDGETIGAWVNELEGADVVINLAGKNVNCRYNEENKNEIYESRLKSTRVLGHAIAESKSPPKLWINSGSATIYRGSFDKLMTEEQGEIGDDFSMDVCKKWEACFNEFKLAQTRKIILRIGIVLGPGGGAMPPLLNLVKIGLGGPQGNGKQYCSWIHQNDFCRAVEYVINDRHAEGVFNVSAPEPLPNKYFMKAMREASKMPVGLAMPEWLLRIGAVFIRTEPELILKSRKVYPKRLLDKHFVFEFADAKAALEDLCRTEARKN
jgi:uncharacterized protein (TIGR01777 family)